MLLLIRTFQGGCVGGLFTIEIVEEDVNEARAHTALYRPFIYRQDSEWHGRERQLKGEGVFVGGWVWGKGVGFESWADNSSFSVLFSVN